MTEMTALHELAANGFLGFGADRLPDTAEWCYDWCRESADSRYCLLGEALGAVGEWWSEHDKYGGVPKELASQIESTITAGLSDVLSADRDTGVHLAAHLRDDLMRLLLTVDDWRVAGYVRTSTKGSGNKP